MACHGARVGTLGAGRHRQRDRETLSAAAPTCKILFILSLPVPPSGKRRLTSRLPLASEKHLVPLTIRYKRNSLNDIRYGLSRTRYPWHQPPRGDIFDAQEQNPSMAMTIRRRAQAAGPTAVINQTLAGIRDRSKAALRARRFWARASASAGSSRADFVDLSELPGRSRDGDRGHAQRGPRLDGATSRTPPIASGSCRDSRRSAPMPSSTLAGTTRLAPSRS